MLQEENQQRSHLLNVQLFSKQIGYTLKELVDMDGIELVAPDFRETVKGHLERGHKGPYEIIGLKKDGTQIPIEVRAREMRSEGHTYRVVAVSDLSVQKQLEAERVDEAATGWGVKIEKIYITDIGHTRNLRLLLNPFMLPGENQ